MEYEIRWGGRVEDVYVRTSGKASLDGLNAFFQEVLQDSRWRPGMRALLDDRGLDRSTMRARDLQARIEGIAAERERIGKAQVATVVARTLDYGLQRMMQAFSGGRLDPEFSEGLFYTLDDARAWLSER